MMAHENEARYGLCPQMRGTPHRRGLIFAENGSARGEMVRRAVTRCGSMMRVLRRKGTNLLGGMAVLLLAGILAPAMADECKGGAVPKQGETIATGNDRI